jgi:TRAP transporter 4TM/12TM fusion protein
VPFVQAFGLYRERQTMTETFGVQPKTAAELAEIERQLDPEINFRPLLPLASLIVGGLLFALSAFHYYTAGLGLLREDVHRGIHLAFVLALVFLVFPMTKHRADRPVSSWLNPLGIPAHDWALALMAAAASLYIPWIFHDLAFRVGNPMPVDVLMGTLAIIVLLEATRRSVGIALPIIAVCLMLYAMYGRMFPGVLVHPGSTWKGVVNHLYLTSQGVYGIALGVVATYVFHYVLFGVLATRIGLGRLFIDLASAVTGRFAGGPAKISILGSALFGMISGSSIANTVTVGSLTIPAMIRLGYQRHFAAAVESTASTGGQITPPIMGAAAFLMVEFLNIPYQHVIIAAIVPAFMHFFGVFCQVHFEALKHGLKGMPPEEIPDPREVLRRDWPAAIPLVVLLAVLFSGYTPYLAAFWGITACLLYGLTKSKLAMLALGAAILIGAPTGGLMTGWLTGLIVLACLGASIFEGLRSGEGKARAAEMVDALILGAKYAISVGAAAATVGIIVGVVTLTGVGFKISNIVTSTAGDIATFVSGVLPFFNETGVKLFFTLLFTAIVCILLGCGVPTTPTYIIMVTVAAPALVMLDLPPIAAHFFVFFYGVLADVTPPVALAAYAGASMAGADPFKTGNTAFRLAIGKALVPFVFAFTPSMLIMVKGFTWAAFWMATISCMLSIVLISAAFSGYMRRPMAAWERWITGFGGLFLAAPGWTAIIIGLTLGAIGLFRQIGPRPEALPTAN